MLFSHPTYSITKSIYSEQRSGTVSNYIRRERMLVATIRTFPITGTSQRARVNKAITLSTPLLGLWSVSKVVVCWVMNEGIAPHHFYPPIPLSFFLSLFSILQYAPQAPAFGAKTIELWIQCEII